MRVTSFAVVGCSRYVVIKIMMYDVSLQNIEIFSYNEGKICQH